jgi:hypothetical protein
MGDTSDASTESAGPCAVLDSMPGSWVLFPSTSRMEGIASRSMVAWWVNNMELDLTTLRTTSIGILTTCIVQQERCLCGLVVAGQCEVSGPDSAISGLQSTSRKSIACRAAVAFLLSLTCGQAWRGQSATTAFVAPTRDSTRHDLEKSHSQPPGSTSVVCLNLCQHAIGREPEHCHLLVVENRRTVARRGLSALAPENDMVLSVVGRNRTRSNVRP